MARGRHSRPRTIGGRPPLFTRAPPHAVLLPPPSSPGRLPPRGEGASGASPDTQSMGAQGGGHRRPATPQGGCRPWLTPESLAAAMAIGQRPTDLTEAEREPLGLRRPPAAGTRPSKRGGPTNHRVPSRLRASPRPERITAGDAPSKGACKQGKSAERRDDTARPRNGQASHRPRRAPKGRAPPMAGQKPERNSLRRSGPGGHPGRGPPGGSGPGVRITRCEGPRRKGRDVAGPGAAFLAADRRARAADSSGTPTRSTPPSGLSGVAPMQGAPHHGRGRESREGRARCPLTLFPTIAISPFHIPTDVAVTNISRVRGDVAGHSGAKCTFDLQNDTVQVFRLRVGPWAARFDLTWSKPTFDGSRRGARR